VAPPSENTAIVVYSHCTNRFEHHTVFCATLYNKVQGFDDWQFKIVCVYPLGSHDLDISPFDFWNVILTYSQSIIIIIIIIIVAFLSRLRSWLQRRWSSRLVTAYLPGIVCTICWPHDFALCSDFLTLPVLDVWYFKATTNFENSMAIRSSIMAHFYRLYELQIRVTLLNLWL